MVITGSLTEMTTAELERAQRDLRVSLALAPEGSPVHLSIRTETALIDAELARRAASPADANEAVDSSPMPRRERSTP